MYPAPTSWGIALLIGLFLGAGCTATRVTTLWTDTEYTGGPFHKLLVVGVSNREGVRRSFEDGFVARLRARGIDAVAAWRVLPDTPRPSQEGILQAARQVGADGILVTRLLGTREETVYTPPPGRLPGPYGRQGVYYGAAWGHVHEPGHYTTYTSVLLETNLYDTRTGNLVWSAQSRTFDPADVKQIIDEVPPEVIEALTTAGLLPPPPQKG